MLTLVIGAGPAGSACALWLHQLGCPVLLLEKNSTAGGLQQFSPYENVWIPSISGRRGMDVASHLHSQLVERGVPMRLNAAVQDVAQTEDGWQVTLTSGDVLQGAFVVLATGSKFKSGGFTSSERLALGPGRGFEALDVVGKRVAVLGGGDNAFDAWNFAMKRGANQVDIYARTVRAQRKLRDTVPCERVILGPFTADEHTMSVNGKGYDAISVQFGFEAVIPSGLEALARTPEGYVSADLWGVSSLEGVYAAGEVTNTLHPCVTTSFAHGIQVAKHIQKRLGR
jgi:thioredoxin reductase